MGDICFFFIGDIIVEGNMLIQVNTFTYLGPVITSDIKYMTEIAEHNRPSKSRHSEDEKYHM